MNSPALSALHFKSKLIAARIICVAAFVLLALAAIAAAIPEKSPMVFYWNHPQKYTVLIYTNGMPWRAFAPEDYTLAGTTNGVNTWTVQTNAPSVSGVYNFTIAAISNGQESDPSDVYAQPIKPSKIQNFYGKEK